MLQGRVEYLPEFLHIAANLESHHEWQGAARLQAKKCLQNQSGTADMVLLDCQSIIQGLICYLILFAMMGAFLRSTTVPYMCIHCDIDFKEAADTVKSYKDIKEPNQT